ncbi:MAG: hypothetical protein J5507_03755 [Clostridia bacterium]|nr:hypothetical protein [Clostridia bacterium]
MFKRIITLLVAMTLIMSMTACSMSTKEVNSRDFNQSNVDTFFDKWYAMDANTSKVLNQFAENFEVDDEFLNNIHAVEEEYVELIAYSKTLTVEEYQYSTTERASIQTELEAGWVREPIMETRYSEGKFTHGWSYNNGVIKIDEGYYVDVDYTENLTTTADPSDYSNERRYTVEDSTKDAYLVFSGELGYEVIRIIAD